MVRHRLRELDVRAAITHSAAEHAARIAPLTSPGFVNTNLDDPGELTVSRAEWEQRGQPSAFGCSVGAHDGALRSWQG